MEMLSSSPHPPQTERKAVGKQCHEKLRQEQHRPGRGSRNSEKPYL